MRSRGFMTRAASLLLSASVFGMAVCALAQQASQPVAGASVVSAQAPTASSAAARLEAGYGRLALHFEPNQGQAPPNIRFVAHTAMGAVLLAPTGLVLPTDGLTVGLTFAGADPAPVTEALEPLPGRVNYYRGRDPSSWRVGIATHRRVRYAGVYPGIDVVVYGDQRRLEYDFVVAPGADPARIRLRVEGGTTLRLDAAGDLHVRQADREIVQQAPIVYQEREGRRERVAGRYLLRGADEIALAIGTYDRARPLVIDPVVVYSTRIGVGTARAIAVDSAGNAYITGENATPGGTDYPLVNPVFQHQSAGFEDVFVTKLGPGGDTLIYSTFIGSIWRDFANALAVDASGNAYVAVQTHNDWPTTPGAFQTSAIGGQDATVSAVAKFGPTGALVYSTFLSGQSFDHPEDPIRGNVCYQGSANGVAADAAGHAYVTGVTSTNDFPTTPGAFIPTKPTVGTRCDTFASGYLTELSPDGASLVSSTYLDGNGSGLAVTVDAAGNTYVAGTASPPSAPPGPLTASLAASGATTGAYVARFDTTGHPTQTTVIGAAATAVTLGPDGSIYVTGTAPQDFTTLNAFQPMNAGGVDGFAARLKPDGTAYIWSTYVGGSADDAINGIAVDSAGNSWLVGYSASGDFPTKNPTRTKTAAVEIVTLELSAAGQPLFGTFLGDGHGYGVAVDAADSTYLTGDAGADFATTPGAYKTTPSGGSDVFVMKLTADKTGPTISLTKPTNNAWTGNSIVVAATASDGGGVVDIKLWGNGGVFGTIPCSGMTSCSGSVTWITGALVPGAYQINAVATGTSGNQTVSATVTIFKDATSPVHPSGVNGRGTASLTASITSPVNGSSVSNTLTVSMAAGNAQGSPIQFVLKLDNTMTLSSQSVTSGSTATFAWTTNGVANGAHTVGLAVTDGAGRTATTSVSVTVSNGASTGDTTPPTVAITKPANGVWTGNSIGISATASDNVAVASLAFWGNGGVFATVTCGGTPCTGTVTWITGPLAPAAYQVQVVATDSSGNKTVSAPVTINKDATSPTVASGAGTSPGTLTASITSPTNGATVSGTGSGVSMAVGNAQSPTQFLLKLDNNLVLYNQSGSGPTASTTWNTTNASNGPHTLNFAATDAAGKTATAAVSVTVSNGTGTGDTTPPTVTITKPSTGAWTGNSIDVTASGSDNVGLATLTYYGDGTQFARVSCGGAASCTSTQWWLTGPLPSGQHTITVMATDTSGNKTTSAPVVINK